MFPETRAVTAETEIDERYTTRETLAWCTRAAGVEQLDLDVAACEEAHCAPQWYSAAENGLQRGWWGRVWCNPPFSDIAPWVAKAWTEVTRPGGAQLVAMLLPATRTDQPWWASDVEPFRDGRDGTRGAMLETNFLPGRVRFGLPGNSLGIGVGSPPFGCVLLVWRRA